MRQSVVCTKCGSKWVVPLSIDGEVYLCPNCDPNPPTVEPVIHSEFNPTATSAIATFYLLGTPWHQQPKPSVLTKAVQRLEETWNVLRHGKGYYE